jgi:hypothetical protein
MPRLASAKVIEEVQTIVYEEFCRWFGVVEAGPREGYGEVSAKIWGGVASGVPDCACLGAGDEHRRMIVPKPADRFEKKRAGSERASA